jgi:hypothetical protein
MLARIVRPFGDGGYPSECEPSRSFRSLEVRYTPFASLRLVRSLVARLVGGLKSVSKPFLKDSIQ